MSEHQVKSNTLKHHTFWWDLCTCGSRHIATCNTFEGDDDETPGISIFDTATMEELSYYPGDYGSIKGFGNQVAALNQEGQIDVFQVQDDNRLMHLNSFHHAKTKHSDDCGILSVSNTKVYAVYVPEDEFWHPSSHIKEYNISSGKAVRSFAYGAECAEHPSYPSCLATNAKEIFVGFNFPGDLRGACAIKAYLG